MKKKIEKFQKKTSKKNYASLEDISKVLGHNDSKIMERYNKKPSFNIFSSYLETT